MTKKFRHHRKGENHLLSNGLLAAGVMRSWYLWYGKVRRIDRPQQPGAPRNVAPFWEARRIDA
ncbi:hypothetical protein M493_01960 [Geobacillus genomosp. 3]|uniref:Uncharacterized protein n=1 Tax=Geobacillus genomosp. 3 TaxID=1921421 RepID=S5Z191_GEOG3|nr:hypothetical protein M493_01960 [Geobacillus genomosp. 3]